MVMCFCAYFGNVSMHFCKDVCTYISSVFVCTFSICAYVCACVQACALTRKGLHRGERGSLYIRQSCRPSVLQEPWCWGQRLSGHILSLSLCSSASLSFFVSLSRACVLSLFSLCLSCSLLSLKHTHTHILVLFLSISFSSFYSHGRSRGAVYKHT